MTTVLILTHKKKKTSMWSTDAQSRSAIQKIPRLHETSLWSQNAPILSDMRTAQYSNLVLEDTVEYSPHLLPVLTNDHIRSGFKTINFRIFYFLPFLLLG